MRSGVYAIVLIFDNRKYVGSSKTIEDRWKKHFRELRKGGHDNPKLQAAFNEYGEAAFITQVLCECKPEREILFEREQYYLDTLRTTEKAYGFNIRKRAKPNPLEYVGPSSVAIKDWHPKVHR